MSNLKSLPFIISVLIMSFLIVFFVLAWTAPTQAPPEGNVPTPLNVGPSFQTKIGNLAAGAFYDANNNQYFIDSSAPVSAIFAGNVGVGTTDPSERLTVAGTIKLTSGGIKFPDDSIQISAVSFIDNDNDGYFELLLDCDDSDPTKWRILTGYLDSDNDGYGAGSVQNICSGDTLPLGYVSNSDDCYDNNADARPGQTSCFTIDRGDRSFDYDCNNTELRCNANAAHGQCGTGPYCHNACLNCCPSPGAICGSTVICCGCGAPSQCPGVNGCGWYTDISVKVTVTCR